jgi:hypothetical protein
MDITDKQIEDIKVGDYVGISQRFTNYPVKTLWKVQHINFGRFGITHRQLKAYQEISSGSINMIVTSHQVEDVINSECETATRRYEEACL